MATCNRRDVVLFGIAALVIGSCFGWISYNNHRRTLHPEWMYTEPIERLCRGYSFSDLAGEAEIPGKISPIIRGKDSDPPFLPYDFKAYTVRLEPPTATITIDGRKEEEVIGLVAGCGIDGDCDFEQASLSVIWYSPTNGTMSNGDNLCLYRD